MGKAENDSAERKPGTSTKFQAQNEVGLGKLLRELFVGEKWLIEHGIRLKN